MALPAEILNGIYNVVQEVIEVNSVVFDVVAGATYCLMPDERKSGVLFIDIGAKVTNICVYKDEVLLLTGVFAWGGDDVTTELAKQCNISYKEAERLKRQYGTLGEINDKTDFANAQKDGQNTVVHRDKLNQIIKQCYRQVFCDIVAYMDSKSIPKEFCDAGIVLAGGGAQMQGMVAYTKKTLRMPVHLANSNPQITLHKERLQDEQIKTLGFEINNRKLYPAFGALLYDLNDELRREQDIYEPTAERSKLWQALHRYKQTLLNWLHRHA